MSQVADLDAASTPASVTKDPTADWGDNLADWHSVSEFLQSPPDRNGRVTTSYSSETTPTVDLTFTGTSANDLVPGDVSCQGTIDLVFKRIAFEVDEKWYYLDALSRGGGDKKVRVRPAKSVGNGPTAWVAEECGPPCSGRG